MNMRTARNARLREYRKYAPPAPKFVPTFNPFPISSVDASIRADCVNRFVYWAETSEGPSGRVRRSYTQHYRGGTLRVIVRGTKAQYDATLRVWEVHYESMIAEFIAGTTPFEGIQEGP